MNRQQANARATRKLEPSMGRHVPPDVPLFAIAMALVAVGLVMVLDTSYARASQGGLTHADPWFFAKQQGMWSLLGLLLLSAVLRLKYWKLRRSADWILGAVILLLVLVWAPHIGVRSHGAARWIKLGGFRFQPSEVAKIGMVIYLAAFLSGRQRTIRSWKKGLPGALLPLALVAALIVKEPDLGTALTLSATSLIMLALGGARLKHLGVVAAAGLLIATTMAMSHSYSRHRLLSFVAGHEGDRTYAYQVSESVVALQAGGLMGRGPGRGEAKFFHLPAPYTDFIAATLGEEFGLFGSFLLLLLFLAFTLRGLQIAHSCRDPFGSLLSAGLCSMVSFQALLNLSVITRTVPDTGVPLPMISFGGTSLVLVMLATGLILNVSRWPDAVDAGALRGAPESPGRPRSSELQIRRRGDDSCASPGEMAAS